MTKVFVLEDVPESDVEEVVGDFESEGCTVEKEKQPNGKFTVRATCPDKKRKGKGKGRTVKGKGSGVESSGPAGKVRKGRNG